MLGYSNENIAGNVRLPVHTTYNKNVLFVLAVGKLSITYFMQSFNALTLFGTVRT